MTGPEFAAAHGNDSSTWTADDFDAEQNLADIDIHNLRKRIAQKPRPRTQTDLTPAA